MKLKFFLSVFLIVFISMASTCDNDSNEVTDKRDNIDDKWAAELNDGGNIPENYVVTITKDATDENLIHLENFVNSDGASAYATLTGFNLTVPEQTVGTQTVKADGTISSNYQEITWDVTIDGDSYTLNFVPGGITKTGL